MYKTKILPFVTTLEGRVKIHILLKDFGTKRKFNDIQPKKLHFVSEIIFEDLAGTKTDKNGKSRG